MKILCCGCLVLFLQWPFASPAAAEPPVISPDQPVSIAGDWRFKTGDHPTWALPGSSDADWQLVQVPAAASEDHPAYSGMAWYRRTMQLDPRQASARSALGVTIGSVFSAYELYAGGELVGSVGGLPPHSEIRYDEHKTWRIPEAAVDADGLLVLALRVWRYEGAGDDWAAGPSGGPFLVGPLDQLSSRAVQSALLPNVLMAALYLVAAIYHLFIARRNPALREFFWFGWFALALGLYSFETSQWRFVVDLPYLLHKKIEFFSLYVAPVLLTQTLGSMSGIRINLAVRGAQLVFAVMALSILAVPNFDVHFATLRAFQILAACWAIGVAVWMAWYARLGNKPARTIVGMMLLLLIVALDALYGGSTGNFIHYAFALMMVLMAVLMADRYTRILATLERSVEARTAELQRTNADLQEAVAAKDQFLANMSHELRTPMNAIIGLTRLGLKTDLSDQQRDYLTKVDASATALRNIIDGVFDFSKLAAGELVCVSQRFRIADVLERVISKAGASAAEKGIAIQLESDPAVPTELVGDAARLEQMLDCFTSNAVKFSEQGEVRVSVAVATRQDQRVALRFAVSDTGIGMAQDQQAKLFQAFSQMDETDTRVHGGAGLGLAVAQGLARLMGGEVRVASRVGEGSTFSVTLPFAVATAAATAAATEEAADLSAIRGAKVLIVDDSEINLQIAGELLRQAGLQVDTALDGEAAVAMVEEGEYDCVLMDLQMPVMDGYSATRQIRSQPQFRRLPILAVSANVREEDRERAETAGMNDHIPKPIDPKELLSKLCQWIEPGQRSPILPERGEASEQAPQLPEDLPGLDIAEALVRLGGNTTLYLKLLQDLQEAYAYSGQDIARRLAVNDFDGAAQFAHKLRGIANNLGAMDVGRHAEGIEAALRERRAVGGDLLQLLEAALAIVGRSLEQLRSVGSPVTDAADISAEDLRVLFEQLRQAISESDPAAEEVAARMLQGVPENAALRPALVKLAEMLDIFDFGGAESQLAVVQAELERSSSTD